MSETPQESCWYAITDSQLAAAQLLKRCAEAVTENYARVARAVLFGSLFEGCTLTTFNQIGYDLVSTNTFAQLQVPIIRNTLRSCALTLLAKVFAVEAPQPKVMSDGGDWEQRTKAEEQDKFLECEMALPQGEFDNLDDMWNHAGLLAIVATGSAAVIIGPGYDQVEAELDDTLTMAVERDGRWGKIQTVVRTVWRDPQAMIARWPGFRKDILESLVTVEEPLEVTLAQTNRPPRKLIQVEYREGWRVKVRGVVGRHMIVLKNGTVLCDDDWERPEWPGVIFHWERQLAGEWGTPATQAVFRECLRENQMIDDVDDLIHNAPGAIAIHPKDADSQMAASKGIQRIEHDFPEKFNFFIPPKLDVEKLNMAANHGQGVHDIMGVSLSQSTAQRAKGTTSGEHEELVAKLFSERFAEQQRRLVECKVIKSGRRFLWAAQDMIKSGDCKEFVRQFAKKRKPGDGDKPYVYEKIDVSCLEFDDARYVLSLAAVGEDKNSPQTRAIKADKFLELGKLSGDQWLQFQRDADLDANTKLSNSQYDWCEYQINIWLSAPLDKIAARYQSIRPFQDPLAAGRQVTNARLIAEQQGAPNERLAWFDKFADECVLAAKREQTNPLSAAGVQAPVVDQSIQQRPQGAAPAPPAA